MMKLGRWTDKRPLFATGAVPRIAGISGGSTSGMMAALCDDKTVLCFQNTGREAKKTYDFLENLADALERPITWLEYRPPPTKGGRPCESRVEVVKPKDADRTGAPFAMFMQAINDFRGIRGKGPIAPWWRSRICTTYVKTRTARTYVNGLGWTAWDEVVGLRADEPSRVEKLRVGVPRRIGRLAPLSEAGVTKEDVDAFWSEQSFSLSLDPLMGNCTGCFLKDQADLSRALGQSETDADWWIAQEKRWPGWGGKNFAGYERLRAEMPARLRIEKDLWEGAEPENEDKLDPARFRLVVFQERKRFMGQSTPFSCGCEGSQALAELDEEQEEAHLLSLPEAS